MQSSTALLILALSFGAQARVLDITTAISNTTSTSTASPSATVIAGSCNQNTLQYCCPLISPTAGQSSVDFATACQQGNLPASFDCFFAFEDICCQSSPDGDGNSCEIVPPAGDVCAPGAAGTIESLGAISGAITVTSIIDCTTSAPSSITTLVTSIGDPASVTSSPAQISSSSLSSAASEITPPLVMHKPRMRNS